MPGIGRGREESLGEPGHPPRARRDQVRHRRSRRLRVGEAGHRRAEAWVLDGSALAGLGQNEHEVTGRMDARRSPAGAISNAAAQTHLGSGREGRMTKLDHIGIAVRSIEAAKIYEALGLTIDHVETVASQGVKTAFLSVGDSNLELLEPTGPDSTIARFIEKRSEERRVGKRVKRGSERNSG